MGGREDPPSTAVEMGVGTSRAVFVREVSLHCVQAGFSHSLFTEDGCMLVSVCTPLWLCVSEWLYLNIYARMLFLWVWSVCPHSSVQ